jgi:structural maintenance of chromosome 4
MDVQNTKRIAEVTRTFVGLPSDVHSQDITDRDFSSKNRVSAADKSRISALDSTIEAATGDLEDIHGRAKGIEDEIKVLEKKILDISSARLLTQKSKLDGLKLHIKLANDEITKSEVAKAKAEENIVKFGRSIKTGKDALSEAEADLEELDQEMTRRSRE